MPRLYILFSLMLSLMLGACAKGNKTLSTQNECKQLLQQADERYNAQRSKIDEAQAARIANLIKAARIDQEHADYTACLDKTSRALLLADQSATPDK